MGCVSEEDLFEYVDRRLPPERLAETEGHLRACEVCRKVLVELVPGAEPSEALVHALETAIEQGDLAPGARLPSERELAGILKLSRTTTTNAYRELESRGVLRRHVGRGTFV